MRGLAAVTLLGALLTILGWLLARERTSAGLLLASHYTLGLGLGGLLFLVFTYVTKAGWSVAFRRVPEAMAGTLPLTAAFTMLAVACMPWLYHWSHADEVAADPLLQEKSAWLDSAGFVVRAALCLVVWLVFAWALRRNSARQDETGGTRALGANVALSAGFLAVFALTFSVASVDWIMSLEPHWYSTVFAIYDFAGLFVSGLAALTVLLIVLRRMGPLAGILEPDHLHDVAKLTFAFVTFWAYIWFCQYMLIWYGHIPEETAYYVARREGAWGVLMIANPVVNWLVPFLVLLPREAKRSEGVLLKVSVLLLLGRWLDLFFMINPSVMKSGPSLGPWELAPLALALPLTLLFFFRVLGRSRMIPLRDPMLAESLHHRT